jgi:hypothetical protein
MGAPSSSILSELYLQFVEHNEILRNIIRSQNYMLTIFL